MPNKTLDAARADLLRVMTPTADAYLQELIASHMLKARRTTPKPPEYATFADVKQTGLLSSRPTK